VNNKKAMSDSISFGPRGHEDSLLNVSLIKSCNSSETPSALAQTVKQIEIKEIIYSYQSAHYYTGGGLNGGRKGITGV